VIKVAKICVMLLAAAFFFTANAQAADASASESSSFFDSLASIATQVAKNSTDSVTKNLYSAGMAIASKLIPGALSLGGALALVFLTFEMLKSLAGKGTGNLLDVLFDVAVPAVIAAALINGYDTRMGQLNTGLDLFRNVAPDPISGLSKYYGAIFGLIEAAIKAQIELLRDASFFSKDIFTKLLDVLATILFSIVIIFIVIAGLAEVLGIILMGPFLFAVGAAFGPVFVATIVTPWSRDYFGKWFGFIVGAALLTGVIGVVVLIAASCLDALSMTKFTSSSAPISIQLAVSAIMLTAVNSLIEMSPGIASALVPGSIGASRGSGAHVTNAKDKSKAAAKGTVQLVKKILGKV